MIRFGKTFLALCLIVTFLVIAYTFLLPLFFKIKEPYFAMPVETVREIKSIADIPIRNDDYGDGEFGAKRKGNRVHKGLDIRAKLKSPVYASKSGWAKALYIPKGYGKLVVIDHPGDWQTRYGHLDSTAIKKAQWVSQGSIIGYIGKTGNANTKGLIPHLHFEIRHKGEPLDPAVELVKKYKLN